MGKNPVNTGKLFIISAPTGAGKTTLTNLILSRHQQVKRAVTYTTRKPRPGETHTIDYFFVDQEIESEVKNISYDNDQMGSDHCPVILTLKNNL